MDEQHVESAAFDRVIRHIIDGVHQAAARKLAEASQGLADAERAIIMDAGARALLGNARRKLSRVLLLELHAAALSERLHREGERERFEEFLMLACRPSFDEHLASRYPQLRPRLDRALMQQADALVLLTRRFVADRKALRTLLDAPDGTLRALRLGEGDVHNKGQAVAQLVFDSGCVMYKPRPVEIDIALDRFLAAVLGGGKDRIRVPVSLARGCYGWSAYAKHRYCRDAREMQIFYRNIGHWLATMRLLGGTDLHYENIIAVGPVPVAVDVESLFAPEVPVARSGCGEAEDEAIRLITISVLRTGLVPFRAPLVGLRGVDISAAGALPDEQPKIRVPLIAEPGTTSARMRVVDIELPTARNHPSPAPDISKHWNDVVDGFSEMTARLRDLDARGQLFPLLNVFDGCIARRIRRPTQAYVEIMRMLWHPASLHNEGPALARAEDVLRRNADVLPIAPSDGRTIAAEIEDMRYGDIPVFSEVLGEAVIRNVLNDWRAMRVEMEELTIRGALITAYLNGRLADRSGVPRDVVAPHPHARDLDARRRALAAATVRKLLRLSIRGGDGTTTWISPMLGSEGWTMSTLQSNLYIGLGGVVVALAGYRQEVRHERVDPVDGLDDVLAGAVRLLDAVEEREAQEDVGAVGAFVGLGSQITTWLMLHGLEGEGWMLQRARRAGEILERRGFTVDGNLDLLEGVSGAIVPLLQLANADRGAEARWLALAGRAGECLEAAAILDAKGACWPSAIFHAPLGGFAHGATGSGWALARLALSAAGLPSDRRRWMRLAERAFDFEESLFDARAKDWIDVRKPGTGEFPNTWCHGSVGIGLAACDLYERTGSARHLDTLRRAVSAAWRRGWGISHTLCHGDLSLWEMLVRAETLDPSLARGSEVSHAARIISGMECYDGAVGGLARDTFTPGLMSGVSGSVYFLCRAHPESTLPSPLLLETVPRPWRAAGPALPSQETPTALGV